MAFIRKQLYLDEETDRRLTREAKQRGVSQAALIRQRLAEGIQSENERADLAPQQGVALNDARASYGAVMERQTIRVTRDRDLLQETLAALDKTIREAGEGAGTGWKLNREELYDERTDRQSPR